MYCFLRRLTSVLPRNHTSYENSHKTRLHWCRRISYSHSAFLEAEPQLCEDAVLEEAEDLKHIAGKLSRHSSLCFTDMN